MICDGFQTAGGIPNYNDYFELSSSKTTLLVIDPQNDFHPGGSLAIANANEDAGRIAKLLKTNAPAIDDVIVSLDTHQKMHVAHGLFWVNEAGEHPAPFTPITEADVTAGVWKTTDPKWQTWGLEYVQKLEANNRFVLLIWPEVRLIIVCFIFFSPLVVTGISPFLSLHQSVTDSLYFCFLFFFPLFVFLCFGLAALLDGQQGPRSGGCDQRRAAKVGRHQGARD